MHNFAVFLKALKTLEDSIELFGQYESFFIEKSTQKNRQLFLAMRDSMIQRFKYCTHLFWKVLKVYLEDVEKIALETFSPRGVVRDAVKARLISEDEGDKCIKMVEARNRTSHIYHEETAETIAVRVPEYYELMKKIIDRMARKL